MKAATQSTLFALAFVLATTSLPTHAHPRGIESLASVGANSQLVALQDINFIPNTMTLIFQKGAIVASQAALQKGVPYCVIHYELDARDRVLRSGRSIRFNGRGSSWDDGYFLGDSWRSTQAGVSSPESVKSVTCYQTGSRFFSLAQLEDALRGQFELRLASPVDLE